MAGGLASCFRERPLLRPGRRCELRGFTYGYIRPGSNCSIADRQCPRPAAEAGWKDTGQARPRMVTRILARFEGFAGRYVCHCRVLEHEDNEMMRPYDVVAPP